MNKVKTARKTVKYMIAESISGLLPGEGVEFPREKDMQVANFRVASSAYGKRYGKKFMVNLSDTAITVTRIK